MAKIEEKCREILDKEEWVSIATTGQDRPHLMRVNLNIVIHGE